MAKEKMVENNVILKCESLHKSYGSKKVLSDFNLTLHEGEVIALMGESGIGKTTILKCINLLEYSQVGRLSFYDQVYFENSNPIFEPFELRRKIGYVLQDFNLFPNLSCLKNITLGLIEVLNKNNKEAIFIANEIAEKLNIKDILNEYPENLSGGQAQRLCIARALVLQPKVLLLDEITSALDPNTTRNVIEAIREIKSINKKMSIIIVTHLFNFAKDFADQIALIANGKVVEQLPAKDFQLKCKTNESKDFLKYFN